MKNHFLYPEQDDRTYKDIHTRVSRYLDWCAVTNRSWANPNLDLYRDYLLHHEGLATTTVAGYISTIKRQFRRLLNRPTLPEELQRLISWQEATPGEFVTQAMDAMQAALDEEAGQVGRRLNTPATHLSHTQILRLFEPQQLNPKTLRNTLVFGLLLFTGMSEVELCALTFSDVVISNKQVAIHIPEVSGGQERFVPVAETYFFDHHWVSEYLEQWKQIVPLTEGALLRGFYRGGNVRPTALNPNAIHEILKLHREEWDMNNYTVMDLRRTFARRLYDNHISLDTLQKFLGFNTMDAVMNAIGLPDSENSLESHRRASASSMLYKLKTSQDEMFS